MRPIGLFIFDLDGTLVNTIEDIAASVNFTLQKLGRPVIPVDQVRQFVGDGLDALLTRALGGPTELLSDARGIYTVHHSRNLCVRSRLYPGVAETLDRLAPAKLAVISNKTIDFVQPLLDGLGLGGRFFAVVGADSGLALKPAPDALLAVMQRAAVPPEKVVVVGDGTTDIRAGKASGVLTCAVTYGFRTKEELQAAGPDMMIDDFSRLAGLFKPERGVQ